MSGKFFADEELKVVKTVFLKLDPTGLRTARVLRNTFDQLYDGQRTGRYCWNQLYKVEREKGGHVVEINLQREFAFQDGVILDYLIAGVEVDCKCSQTFGGWMIPPEAREHLCLLVWAMDNKDPKWSMGLVRASDSHLNAGSNRDSKATLNEAGRKSIVWLFKDDPLPPNVLLSRDEKTVEKIMSYKTSGQKRIDELLRSARGKIIGRAAVATVAQQHDYMKRLRTNGGARTTLKREGIIVLGQYESHREIARSLGVPVPGEGDTVSVKVALAKEPGAGVVKIGRQLWRVARADDDNVTAPDLPKI